MEKIIKEIKRLQKSEIKTKIDSRLKEFYKMQKKKDNDWFLELCFCLLTANTSAEMGLKMQKNFGFEGFTCNRNELDLQKKLHDAHCRFYKKRAHFIHLACIHKNNLKNTISKLSHDEKREWLVKNIKGIGYKEASHFLRNVGYFDYAILDKHILRTLHENKLITEVPKSLNAKKYIEYETILKRICNKMHMTQGELDMYLWYMKTGKILK